MDIFDTCGIILSFKKCRYRESKNEHLVKTH